jgi:hypothetical protein
MGSLPPMSVEEADATVVREVFARIDAQAALPGLTSTIAAWRPDVVLREPAELGSLAAAESAGLPHAQVAIGMQETVRSFLGLTEEPLAELARLAGLPAGRLTEAWWAEPSLSAVPAALDRAGDDGFDEDLPLARFAAPDPAPAAPGPWPEWGDPGLPLVYVTLGSVTGSLPPFAGLFGQALHALAALPVRVFMTVGRRLDLESLRPLPANAYAVPWWPQGDALGRADAVLGHGGFGTTMGALAAGLPQVVAPIFTCDQAVNGRHVAAAGAGRTVSPGPDLMARAAAELAALLTEPSYAGAARTLAGELRALPDVAGAVTLLERMAG